MYKIRGFNTRFMQFNLMKETHMSQGEVSKIAITGDMGEYERYPLIGGGYVLVSHKVESVKKIIDFQQLSFKRNLSIAVDEDESN